MPIIAIEGNIGAGKSTLLRQLANRGMRVVDEPLKKWRGEEGGGSNLLELFYSEPKRWAFTFQTAAFLTRAQSAASAIRAPDAPPNATWVLERSLLSDKHCFATNCYKTDLFTLAEWGVYQDYHSWLMAEFPTLNLDGAVYVRTEPTTCLQRLQKRGRAEESSIPLDYLQQLHSRHEEWLVPTADLPAPAVSSQAPWGSIRHALSSDGVPVLVLDGEADFEGAGAQDDYHEAITAFVDSLIQGDKPTP